ncbi:MAG TPA: prepilin-type N-terminal cleavage/methylation domain-containing protein [Candidatus Andersenbacteria bacterium]|nr:prepilin-type N-terminal cleavage/methylation domain-containing protein [Candidatus Andersenbacteria bacterium]
MTGHRHNRGLTLVEVLVSLSIIAIILGAISLFIGRAFRIPREAGEQGAIVHQAQRELTRLNEWLRNARETEGEGWISEAGPCELQFWTNIDGDSEAEEVHLTFNDRRGTLNQGGRRRRGEVLAEGIRNDCRTTPLFTYYSLGGGRAVELESTPPDLTEIDRIAIRLIIDVDVNQPPGAATVETVVTPRGGESL